jgi:hypothetical protein
MYNDAFTNLIDKYILITTPKGLVLFKCLEILGTFHEFKLDIVWLNIKCYIYKHSKEFEGKNGYGIMNIYLDRRDWKILTDEEFKVEVI